MQFHTSYLDVLPLPAAGTSVAFVPLTCLSKSSQEQPNPTLPSILHQEETPCTCPYFMQSPEARCWHQGSCSPPDTGLRPQILGGFSCSTRSCNGCRNSARRHEPEMLQPAPHGSPKSTHEGPNKSSVTWRPSATSPPIGPALT